MREDSRGIPGSVCRGWGRLDLDTFGVGFLQFSFRRRESAESPFATYVVIICGIIWNNWKFDIYGDLQLHSARYMSNVSTEERPQ